MTASSNFGRLTGVVYLAMGLAGFFHLMFVPSRVFVHGDAAATARRLAESAGLFRLGIVGGLLSALGFLFLVLMLHELLAPFGRRLAAVMVILVLVSLPISFVNCFNWMAALILTGDASFLAAIPKPQLDAWALFFLRLWGHGNYAAELFWGAWLLPFGALVWRSRTIPRAIGVLLAVGGVAYVVHGLVALLLPGPKPALYQYAVLAAWTAAEVPIVLWLLIRGAERPRGDEMQARAGF